MNNIMVGGAGKANIGVQRIRTCCGFVVKYSTNCTLFLLLLLLLLWKQSSLYKICVSTCDDWLDGHDLFPCKQFKMAGDRLVQFYFA